MSSMPRVERYAEKTLAKMFQEPLPYWHEYQWQPQAELDDNNLAVDPEKIIDIKGRLALTTKGDIYNIISNSDNLLR